MLILDIITILGGLMLIIAPDWCYNAMRRPGEKQEVPANWHRNSRIFGVIFLAAGGFFVYNTIVNGGLGL